MFITLHDTDGEILIRAEAIDTVYKLVEGETVIWTRNYCTFHVTESVEEIKKMIAPEAFHAEWQEISFNPDTGATLYRCSKCGMESYYPFEVCPVCLSRMKKKGE